jgi:hypothetical protein
MRKVLFAIFAMILFAGFLAAAEEVLTNQSVIKMVRAY